MIEDIFYLDEGRIKITAASVGIGLSRWICIKENEITLINYKDLMRSNRFDILPIVSNDETIKEYFKTNEPNNYDKIERIKITYEDVLTLETPIREVIKGFVTDEKSFYFLTFQSNITGLITIGNLNCRQVQIYIFGLICELERKLGNFIENKLEKDKIENFISEKSQTNEKLTRVWEHYKSLAEVDLENNLIEHLFLIDFFSVIEYFELYKKLNYSKNEWHKLSGINNLRHLVAHPTRSLLDKENNIERLWRRIGRIEDVIFRINQIT